MLKINSKNNKPNNNIKTLNISRDDYESFILNEINMFELVCKTPKEGQPVVLRAGGLSCLCICVLVEGREAVFGLLEDTACPICGGLWFGNMVELKCTSCGLSIIADMARYKDQVIEQLNKNRKKLADNDLQSE